MNKKEEKEMLDNWNSTYERINRLYHKWETSKGINSFELQTLSCMYPDAVINQKDICEKHDIPKQTVSYIVAKLIAQGYLMTSKDEIDGRAKKICLTEKGRKYAENNVILVQKLDTSVIRKLGKDTFTEITASLNTFGDALEDAIDEK